MLCFRSLRGRFDSICVLAVHDGDSRETPWLRNRRHAFCHGASFEEKRNEVKHNRCNDRLRRVLPGTACASSGAAVAAALLDGGETRWALRRSNDVSAMIRRPYLSGM